MKVDDGHRSRPLRARVLAVEGGQVVCPRRGIVDLELCWSCPAYRGLSTGHREGVICGTEFVFLSIAARWPATSTRTGSQIAEMGSSVEDVP